LATLAGGKGSLQTKLEGISSAFGTPKGGRKELMQTSLFLLGASAVAMVLLALKKTAKTNAFVAKRLAIKPYASRAISMLILTAQVSELVRVVEHVSIVNIAAALMLLAIIVATKSGTEGSAR
jgi:hypothetical protein